MPFLPLFCGTKCSIWTANSGKIWLFFYMWLYSRFIQQRLFYRVYVKFLDIFHLFKSINIRHLFAIAWYCAFGHSWLSVLFQMPNFIEHIFVLLLKNLTCLESRSPSQSLTHLPEGGHGAHAWTNTNFGCSFWNVYVWIQSRHWVVATCSWLYILILFSSQLCRLQGWERLLEEWTDHLREDTWEQPAGYRDVWLSNTVDKKPVPLTHGWVQPQVRRAPWLRFWSALEEQRYYEHIIRGPWLGDTYFTVLDTYFHNM